MMKASHHGLLCALLLGIGELCLFAGFDCQAFIAEPMMHAIAERKPDSLSPHAGYYGQALIFFFDTVGSFLAPWIKHHIGSRMTLMVGSCIFTLYFCSFFYIRSYFYYIASSMMGIGFALFHIGEGGYLTEHSTKLTIERNTSLSWAIANTCMIVGGIVMLFTIKPSVASTLALANATMNGSLSVAEIELEQDYSMSQIRNIFGAFAAIAFLANCLFLFLPRQFDPSSIAGIENADVGFVRQIKKTTSALMEPRILMLTPLFILLGSLDTFWMGVYPTTLTFSSELAPEIYLPAYYSICVGCGEFIVGMSISYLSKKNSKFGSRSMLILGSTTVAVALLLICFSTPAYSSIRKDQYDPTLWLAPSVPLTLVIALMLGGMDSCMHTVRIVMCAVVLPDKSTEAFAIGRFYQSLTCCIIFFASSFMTIPVFVIMLLIKLTIAATLCLRVLSESADSLKKLSAAIYPSTASASRMYIIEKSEADSSQCAKTALN